MPITLELSQELERELSAEAAQLGLPLNEYILRLLTAGRAAKELPKTGSDLVAYWQSEDLIGTRPDITDSQQYACQIRQQAER